MKRISVFKYVLLAVGLAAVLSIFGAAYGFAATAVCFLALNAAVASFGNTKLGVACTSLDTINDYFAQAKNQFTLPLYNWIWRTNPWYTIIPRSMFEYQDGLIPEVNTSTSELPTAYPDLGNVTLSNGTGNSACVSTPTTVLDGYINRNFRLEKDTYQTRVFCLTDLQFSWQAAQQASNLYQNLKQYTTVRWSDWYRVKNICMIDTKVSTGTGSTYDQDQNAECDFSNVSLPTAELNWDHLNCFYDAQIRLGAEPVGYSEGQQLYTLSVGPGYKRKLWQTDTLVRDTVNWADPFQNFTARGINTSINGYVPNVDDFPIRYAADGTTKIYPTLNVAASVGRKNIPNPDYLTVARGGLAVYEVFTILPRNVWEVKVRPSGPTNFDGMAFNPIEYVGDPMWINNKDMCQNVEGNMGFYRMNLSMAAKPVRPEVGYTGLTLAKDC